MDLPIPSRQTAAPYDLANLKIGEVRALGIKGGRNTFFNFKD
jgi:hypothetical protein